MPAFSFDGDSDTYPTFYGRGTSLLGSERRRGREALVNYTALPCMDIGELEVNLYMLLDYECLGSIHGVFMFCFASLWIGT